MGEDLASDARLGLKALAAAVAAWAAAPRASAAGVLLGVVGSSLGGAAPAADLPSAATCGTRRFAWRYCAYCCACQGVSDAMLLCNSGRATPWCAYGHLLPSLHCPCMMKQEVLHGQMPRPGFHACKLAATMGNWLLLTSDGIPAARLCKLLFCTTVAPAPQAGPAAETTAAAASAALQALSCRTCGHPRSCQPASSPWEWTCTSDQHAVEVAAPAWQRHAVVIATLYVQQIQPYQRPVQCTTRTLRLMPHCWCMFKAEGRHWIQVQAERQRWHRF